MGVGSSSGNAGRSSGCGGSRLLQPAKPGARSRVSGGGPVPSASGLWRGGAAGGGGCSGSVATAWLPSSRHSCLMGSSEVCGRGLLGGVSAAGGGCSGAGGRGAQQRMMGASCQAAAMVQVLAQMNRMGAEMAEEEEEGAAACQERGEGWGVSDVAAALGRGEGGAAGASAVAAQISADELLQNQQDFLQVGEWYGVLQVGERGVGRCRWVSGRGCSSWV